MRSPSSITVTERPGRTHLPGRFLLVLGQLFVLAVLLSPSIAAQPKVAMITPERSEQTSSFTESLTGELSKKLKVLDLDLAASAFASVGAQAPFNMTADESKRAGAVIGCEFLILTKAATQRRSAFGKPDYFEAYAPVYLVSGRTGRLTLWELQKFEAPNPAAAEKLLSDSVADLAQKIEAKIAAVMQEEINGPVPPQLEEVPDAGSPGSKNFRAPIPYRRVKPEYTETAALYDVTATVEILVDTDAKGSITRSEITRWAGYGLDESVERTVRAMNWRPAERNGKALPMRFLLRYNFKKLPKETDK